MLILIANLLVIVGSVILISTLFSIQRLFYSLPSREIRAKKYFLIMPILFFILGYLGYLVTFWNAQRTGMICSCPEFCLSLPAPYG
jgi:hypothetical protein